MSVAPWSAARPIISRLWRRLRSGSPMRGSSWMAAAMMGSGIGGMTVLPIVRGLVGRGGAKQDGFGEGGGGNLQADRKAAGVEAAGKRDRRQAGQVVRIGQAP